jgi:dephospho-CoA kinase
MKAYEHIVTPRMKEIIFNEIKHTECDIVLVERAALIENNMTDIVGNNIVLATCEKDVQEKRRIGSDLPAQQVKNRYSYFWEQNKKKEYINTLQ